MREGGAFPDGDEEERCGRRLAVVGGGLWRDRVREGENTRDGEDARGICRFGIVLFCFFSFVFLNSSFFASFTHIYF